MKLKSKCPHCQQPFDVTPGQIDEVVNCPNCFGRVKVAAPRQNAKKNMGVRYTFECPSCESPLEATSAMAGQSGRCPSCATDIIIPEMGKLAKIKPDENTQNGIKDKKAAAAVNQDGAQPLHEIHAFAAAGLSAPKIVKLDNGKSAIACPKCNFRNSSSASFCNNCAMPFSIENRTDSMKTSGATARNSLIFAILSLPMFMVGIFQIVAIILAATALSSRKPSEKRRRYPAYIAMVLALISLAAAIISWAS